jgi:hypothetical protein
VNKRKAKGKANNNLMVAIPPYMVFVKFAYDSFRRDIGLSGLRGKFDYIILTLERAYLAK